jgi:thioesterase domain-containing protein
VLHELDPEPPYRLVGWSFGGVVALELARRLRTEGEEVAFVALLDCQRPRIRPVKWRDALPYHLREAALLPSTEARRDYARRELRYRVGRKMPNTVMEARRRLRQEKRKRTGEKGGQKGWVKPTSPLIRSIHRSYLNYEASPVDFPVALFPTQGSTDRCHGDPSLHWAPFLRGGFTVHPVPGDHLSMCAPPHVDIVAQQLHLALAWAETAPPYGWDHRTTLGLLEDEDAPVASTAPLEGEPVGAETTIEATG